MNYYDELSSFPNVFSRTLCFTSVKREKERNPIEARENAFSVDINENFIECADALSYCRVVSIVDEFQEERKKSSQLPTSCCDKFYCFCSFSGRKSE